MKRKRIIYVMMYGRFGNQLFQYAFARMLQERLGGEIWLDYSDIEKENILHPNEGWDNVLNYYKVKQYKYIGLAGYIRKNMPQWQWFLFRLIKKIRPKANIKKEFYFDKHLYKIWFKLGLYFYECNHGIAKYISPITNNVMVRGWFESADYFKEIDETIRKEFTPIYEIFPLSKKILQKIEERETICVTVRRGDFLAPQHGRFRVCSELFYTEGVSTILQNHPDAQVLVCSDDIQWCKKNLKFQTKTIYEPEGLPIWEKMRIMSSCHHFVISNSSFSWWAQHLSKNEEKMVIAPKIWRHEEPKPDTVFEKNWICIDI